MRKAFYLGLFLVFLCSNFLAAQELSWDKITTNYGEQLSQVHYFESDYMIGFLNNPEQIAISPDRGESWTFEQISFGSWRIIGERADGLILFHHGCDYFVLDKSENKFTPLTIEGSVCARDLFFLEDNKLIIATTSGFLLYDTDFQLLAEYEIGLSQLRLVKTGIDTYSIFSRSGGEVRLYELNTNTYMLTEKTIICIASF